MVTVFDVAQYILQRTGPITAMKLQKLVYYSQAWSLVWDDEPLFPERIEAWANGPVIPDLFKAHRGLYQVGVRDLPGNPDRLSKSEAETVDAIVESYGNKSSQWLIELTHSEEPWKNARSGLLPGERSNREIALSDIADYYSSLLP